MTYYPMGFREFQGERPEIVEALPSVRGLRCLCAHLRRSAAPLFSSSMAIGIEVNRLGYGDICRS